MFLNTTKQGWKETERFIQWGHQQSLPRPDPEGDVPTIKLVGYWTSCQKISITAYTCWEGHLVHHLVGPNGEKRLSKTSCPLLRDHLYRWGYIATPEEEARGAAVATPLSAHQWESWARSRRREDLHHEALWEARKVHQQDLEAAHMLECDIERLSRGVEDTKYPCPCSHSSSHPWSQSLDRCLRSPSRYRQERWVTFWEPEVELDPSEWPYRGHWGHPFGIHLDSDGVPLLFQRQGQFVPQRCPYPTQTLVVGSHLPEPSIKNIKVWL